ncbi:MAG: low-specificity L-threonine aldolase [Candidatus Dormibacteraeota bacterium]|nr:low-specificity L-threonine aldolase [Candidatus Dormibacteraeota bacterium]
MIDLRSDTVTQPTPAMRRAMAEAELGDDVFGEDPTVNRLEARAAALLGKEAGLFVPSGTMSNLIGLLVLARAGQEVVVESDAHILYYEGGGAAIVGGIQLRPIPGRRGVFTAQQLEAVIRPKGDVHQPPTAAVCVENSHNRQGGAVWPLDVLRELSDAARSRGIGVHLDGARIFNAALATGVPARQVAECADTVNFCLSKGLACPVGSLLVGSAAHIEAGRRWRKMLGGGMRQAGVIAAAGLLALDTMIERLADDHRHARLLASLLAEFPGLHCDVAGVETNIVLVDLPSATAAEFAAECRERSLLVTILGPRRVRFVTHHGIEREHVEAAAAAAAESARALVPRTAGRRA